MTPGHFHSGNEFIVYDASSVNQPWTGMFDPDAWFQLGPVERVAAGRGAAWHVRGDGSDYALRHYRRGGFVARVVSDLYLWTGLERTRAFREWRLLAELVRMGLPVTRPVAARVVRQGPLYRAAILTHWIDGARPLAERLATGALAGHAWQAVGTMLRRFHDAGAYHADLNAWNILLDGSGRPYLVDFDRGRLRTPGDSWRRANLARLRRSLARLRSGHAARHVREVGWPALVEGYGQSG